MKFSGAPGRKFRLKMKMGFFSGGSARHGGTEKSSFAMDLVGKKKVTNAQSTGLPSGRHGSPFSHPPPLWTAPAPPPPPSPKQFSGRPMGDGEHRAPAGHTRRPPKTGARDRPASRSGGGGGRECGSVGPCRAMPLRWACPPPHPVQAGAGGVLQGGHRVACVCSAARGGGGGACPGQRTTACPPAGECGGGGDRGLGGHYLDAPRVLEDWY